MILEVAKDLMTLDGSEDIGGLGRALGDSGSAGGNTHAESTRGAKPYSW